MQLAIVTPTPLTVLNGGVTEGCVVEAGACEKAVDEGAASAAG